MRLRTRLLLILLAVISTGSLLTFVIFRSASRGLFQNYIFSGDREKAKHYAILLGEYYAGKKGWIGVQEYLFAVPRLALLEADGRLRDERPEGVPAPPRDVSSLTSERIVLADGEGFIEGDTAGILLGTRHPPRHLAGGIPVTAESRRVGTVLVGSMIDSSLTDTAEDFLKAMTRAFIASALASGLLAFLLGLIFTLRITRILGAISEGARKIGSGKPTERIPVRGKDETAEMAASFNRMAEKLEKLSEAKRRMIADSAHELRTPLTLIRGAVEGMIDGVLPADIPTLNSVHEETLRLSRLVDTLREIETIESGRLELNLESIDAADLCRRAASLFAKAAAEKDIRLSVETDGGVPPRVRGDYLRLGQVLHNLLANALRYTPRGGRIRVTAGGEGRTAVLTVEDSGPGIPEGERDRIFERFYRLDRSRSSGEGGRGLGLAIAREIVTAHGGSLAAGVSDLGGAAFRMELPADPNPED